MLETRSSGRSRALIFAGMAAVTLLGTSACTLDLPSDVDSAILLEGPLVALTDEYPLTGSAAAVTQFGNTDISIGAEGLEPEGTYGWFVRSGTCDGEGTIFGFPAAYQDMQAGEDGDVSAVIRNMDAELRRGRRYSAHLVDGGGHDGTVLACADLEEQEF
jgi:hypothetical protein